MYEPPRDVITKWQTTVPQSALYVPLRSAPPQRFLSYRKPGGISYTIKNHLPYIKYRKRLFTYANVINHPSETQSFSGR